MQYFMHYSINYSFDFFEAKQENQQKCEKIWFFLNVHIEGWEAENKDDF